jgi:large subunit ribosomal protein L13
MIVDGENLLLGRIGAVVAKKALEGEEIFVVNCEKVMISGAKVKTIQDNLKRLGFGSPRWGPFIPRQAFRYVKRAFRGMLPYKVERGKEAFARIICYNKVPKEFQDKEFDKIPNASVNKLSVNKYVAVGEICERLGGKQ